MLNPFGIPYRSILFCRLTMTMDDCVAVHCLQPLQLPLAV